MRGRWGTQSETESETERKADSGDSQTDSFWLEADSAQDLIQAWVGKRGPERRLRTDWLPLWLDYMHSWLT